MKQKEIELYRRDDGFYAARQLKDGSLSADAHKVSAEEIMTMFTEFFGDYCRETGDQKLLMQDAAVAGNFAGLDANGNLVDSGKKAEDFQEAGDYKTTQDPVADPTADGTGIEFIDSISQDANGEITPHKKSVQAVTASSAGVGGQAGLMAAADKEKLDLLLECSDDDIDSIFA